jgi:hypothetical protein
MDKTDFDRFVEQQRKLAEPAIDRQQMREDWLRSVASLYETVEGYLKDYKENGSVRTSRRQVHLNEELLGSYGAEALTITIGNKQITLNPVARVVIGAMGRVDIIGPAGRSRLVRVFESSKGITVSVTVHTEPVGPRRDTLKSLPDEVIVWKLVTPPPNLQYFELTKERFLETLVEVSNG